MKTELDEEFGAVYDEQKREVRFYLEAGTFNAADLCLFDKKDKETKIPMEYDEKSNRWKATLKNISPEAIAEERVRYGYRCKGKYNPKEGYFHNEHKLLTDVYALKIDRPYEYNDALLSNVIGNMDIPDSKDSAPYMPKCVVINRNNLKKIMNDGNGYALSKDSLESRSIEEVHVKSITAKHPDVPVNDRGRFAGMAHPAVINDLKERGITTVEIMPFQPPSVAEHLGKQGKKNYWGYDTVNFMAVNPEYGDIEDLAKMVKTYKANGIEVIADVAFHTGEGGPGGQSLGYKGSDYLGYYKINDESVAAAEARGEFGRGRKFDDKSVPDDCTGCGNSLDFNKPAMQKLFKRALGLYVDMGIAGFRYDLASSNARNEAGEFDAGGAFLNMLRTDEKLKKVIHIMEPWAATNGSTNRDLYQIEGFKKAGFHFWDGQSRDTIRTWTSGGGGAAGKLARLIAEKDTKAINFVTCHDGYTLHDFLAYKEKNNYANGENNRDGDNSHGLGLGDNKDLILKKGTFAMTTMMLLGGTPMFTSGDSILKTQGGNNNAYCQDSDISYVNYENQSNQAISFKKYLGELASIRNNAPALFAGPSFNGGVVNPEGDKDVAWLNPNGSEMQGNDWNNNAFSYKVSGDRLKDGRIDNDYMVIMNAQDHGHVDWKLPASRTGKSWQVICKSSDVEFSFKREKDADKIKNNEYRIYENEVVILMRPREDGREVNRMNNKHSVNMNAYSKRGNGR